MALNAGLLKQIANPVPPQPARPGRSASPTNWVNSSHSGSRPTAWTRCTCRRPARTSPASTCSFSTGCRASRARQVSAPHPGPGHPLLAASRRRGLPDSKTCYERAGMDGKVAHSAVEDALAVVRLVRMGINRVKPNL